MKFRRPPLVLWRYIGREIGMILVAAVLAQALMNIGIVAYQLVQEEGLRLSYAWPLLLKMSTVSLYYTIPISLLFAVTLGMGRMVADLEVTALKASGISYAQILMPAILLALACTALTQYLNGEVIPPIRYERRNLKKVFLSQLSNMGYGAERTITLPRGIGQIHCEKYYGNTLYGVTISVWKVGQLTGETRESPEQEEQAFPVTIRAQKAVIDIEYGPSGQDRLLVRLVDAKLSVPDDILNRGSGDPLFLQKLGVGNPVLPISLIEAQPGTKDKATGEIQRELRENEEALARIRIAWDNEKDLEARKQLEASMGDLRRSNRKIEIELGRRSAFALSCFSFLWIGAPLTIWLNSRNRLIPFFFGNVAAIGVFYPLITLSSVLVEKADLPESVLESGNAALVLGGCVILWRLRRT